MKFVTEVYSFGDSIHDRHDGVMSGGLREFDHKIDTKGIPPCIRNGERLKLANRRMLPRFHLKAEVASTIYWPMYLDIWGHQ